MSTFVRGEREELRTVATIGSVDDPSAPSESEILDNQETDYARKGCGHQRIHGLIPNQPTEGIAESRRDDHVPGIPASHRNLTLRGRGALLVTVPSFSTSTSEEGMGAETDYRLRRWA